MRSWRVASRIRAYSAAAASQSAFQVSQSVRQPMCLFWQPLQCHFIAIAATFLRRSPPSPPLRPVRPRFPSAITSAARAPRAGL